MFLAHGTEEFVPKTPLTTGKQLLSWYIALPLISIAVILLGLIAGSYIEKSNFKNQSKGKSK